MGMQPLSLHTYHHEEGTACPLAPQIPEPLVKNPRWQRDVRCSKGAAVFLHGFSAEASCSSLPLGWIDLVVENTHLVVELYTTYHQAEASEQAGVLLLA